MIDKKFIRRMMPACKDGHFNVTMAGDLWKITFLVPILEEAGTNTSKIFINHIDRGIEIDTTRHPDYPTDYPGIGA